MRKNLFSIVYPMVLTLFIAQKMAAQFSYVQFNNTREVNTGILFGGRTLSLAANPANSDIVLAATETGGINKTNNRGRTWTHLENFPCLSTIDIAYTDATGNNIIVTTKEDFKATNGGGIWRSEDGGNTWTQCPITYTNPASYCNGHMVAWNIAKSRNRILVATDCGIAISTDGGRTFTNKPIGRDEGHFKSIAAYENRVIIGGDNGIYYSENEGDDFTQEQTGIGALNDFHAITWGENFGSGTRVAYAITLDSRLYFSNNGGQNWQQITSAPPGGGGCGGTRFIAAIKTGTTSQQLYYGNTCSAFVLNSNRPLTGGNYDFTYTNPWRAISFEHGFDCYQMIFDNSVTPAAPYMLATDGGVEGTADGGFTWRSMGKASSGFNALQIMDVSGQLINNGAVRNQTIYFATQDNDLWASNNNAASFPGRTIFEGYNFQMARQASSYTNTRIHYITCLPCGNKISKPLFAEQTEWTDVASRNGSPFILKEGVFLQHRAASFPVRQGISITNDFGVRWRNLANLTGVLRGEPKLGKTASGYVLYQGVKTGNNIDDGTNADIIQLARIDNFDETGTLTPRLRYAAMGNFGSFGIMKTMFPWYEVYGVDYHNPDNMIAADYTHQKMKRSRNGGDDWEDLNELTNMITDGGRLNFRFSNNAGAGLERFTQASLVSYHPEFSGYVIVGTREAGIFFSSDNGSNWVKIPGTERISNITAAYWAGFNKIYIGSYGRGLWVINYELRNRFEDLPRLCREPCWTWADPRKRVINPELNEQLASRVIVARGGVITGWRAKGGILSEIMVMPGTQVVYYNKDLKTIPGKIQITETDKDGKYEGAEDLVYEQLKLQKNIQGISINETGEIGEMMITNKLIERFQPEPVKYAKDIQQQNPVNEGKAIIYLQGGSMINGTPVIPAGDVAITILGESFTPDKTPVEIFVDGKLYNTIYAGQTGNFTTAVKGNYNTGTHVIKAVQKTKEGIKAFSNSFRCNNADGNK